MEQHVTLLPPKANVPDKGGISSSLPPDLLDQIRGRVGLVALLMMVAFSFDPLLYLLALIAATVMGVPIHFGNVGFRIVDLCAISASAALWWASRNRSVSPALLHTIGLVYEVVICFIISFVTIWAYYLEYRAVPNLTWVPAIIIFFPLVLPGPPRRMLAAAIVSGAMPPLSLLLLVALGKVSDDGGGYFESIVGSTFAVLFAYMGARVVYGLGREVAAARELGSYHLEELLGEGGMGQVWRARHRMLARPAAIKLIRPANGADGRMRVSEEMARRFEREAQVIAQLRSPHTVDLFDFGVADNGSFYYVMELLEGLNTDTLVRRFGPLSAERVIYLLTQICHSLSEAESCGLIHRDIKPANIVLCRYGEDCDFVKVLDFGLVKAFVENEKAEPALTRENMVHGTPAFIAPEQAMGRVDIDGRVDIYATGCVAYWLLTGKLVFSAETSMGYLMHHIHTTPRPPSAVAELPIPADLEQLILSCLAKDPADRPQSARELSAKLSEIDLPKPWTEEQARQWWNRHQPLEPKGAVPIQVPELVAP